MSSLQRICYDYNQYSIKFIYCKSLTFIDLFITYINMYNNITITTTITTVSFQYLDPFVSFLFPPRINSMSQSFLSIQTQDFPEDFSPVRVSSGVLRRGERERLEREPEETKTKNWTMCGSLEKTSYHTRTNKYELRILSLRFIRREKFVRHL